MGEEIVEYPYSSKFNYEYNDPDKEHELLDNDSYTDDLSEVYKSRATSIETDQCDYDLDFDEVSLRNVKEYITSKSREFEEDENDIDWLGSELDIKSETDSLWTSITDENEEDYEVKEGNININKTDSRCAIVDIVDGNLVHCSNKVFRPLRQLIGIWELDFNSVNEIINTNQKEEASYLLGVCSSHFNFDQNKLHNRGLKNSVSTEKSWIYKRRCLFCYNDKYFFSRGGGCTQHSWKVIERNVHISCCGLNVCPIFTENILVGRSLSTMRPRYICSTCFESEGGHYYQRKGRGSKLSYSCTDNHIEDNNMSLDLLGRWIQDVAISSEQIIKDLLLEELSLSLLNFFKRKSQLSSENNEQKQRSKPNLPSLLAIKIALRLNKVNLVKMKDANKYCNLFKKQSKELGEAFGIIVWHSRLDIRKNKKELEEPQSLEQYYNGFPICIRNFFDGLITLLQKKKMGGCSKKT